MSMQKSKELIAGTIRRGITHYKSIAADIGRTEGTVKKVLSIMKKEGQAFPKGKGHWQLPDVQPDDPEPLKPGPAPKPDYARSNETALQLVVDMREIVAGLMKVYKVRKGPFPKDEIHSLKTLEFAYKEKLKLKTQLCDEARNTKIDNFIILPHNKRGEITIEEYADRLKYEAAQLHLANEFPKENVIIEDKPQLSFPFYPL